MKEKKEEIKFILFLAIILVVLLNNVIAQEGQETLYCAEKTLSGAKCMDVPLSEVNTGFRYDRTSCSGTSYCSEGTCVNTKTGECVPGPQATCDPAKGGFFYSEGADEVSQCQLGCCILGGDEAKFVERVACDVLGSDYNVNALFRSDIRDESSCRALASPEEKGACVFETEKGRECTHETREQCTSTGGEFYPGFLCTAPQLGTICSITPQRTKCIQGQNDVYFSDSCGNTANIYDANKANDVSYWSYMPGVEGVEVNVGDDEGNIDSDTYGYCGAGYGSICKLYDRGVDSKTPKYGDYICGDMSCAPSELTLGVKRANGEEWCSEPLSDFEDAKPGQISYAMYCLNGRVGYETCDHYRNRLCMENDEGGARCVDNRWWDCMFMNNTDDCLNEDFRDCEVIRDASALRTQYGTEKTIWDSEAKEDIIGVCVPKYTPGFKFWDSTGTISDVSELRGESPFSICNFASVECTVQYTKEIIGVTDFRAGASKECVELCKSTEGWSESKCYKKCTPVCLVKSFGNKNSNVGINKEWATAYENLCNSLGDCGVSGNYLNVEGYNSWKDLFTGKKINWDTLPNGESKK